MVGEDLLAWQQTTCFGFPGGGQRGVGAHQQLVYFGHQPLRAEGAPVGVAHVLQDVLRDFAPTFLGHEDLIGLLLGAVIGHAEIQQAPAQAQAIEFAIALLGGRRTQADLAVFDTDGGTARIVVSPGITGRGHQLG
ncbi:hypothetical protein D3C78_1187010 [compost metagenome]